MFSLIPRATRREMARAEPLDWFRREFASLFDRALPAWMPEFEVPVEFRWGLETEEAEKEFVVRAEMPGFEIGEIEVNVTGNVLAIRAEHRIPEGKEPPANRPVSRLERTLTLPEGANPEGITAAYRNGMLEIHLPKVPASVPRKIEVTA